VSERLDHQSVITLAGEDVRTLAEAADVEPVLPAQVADAEQAAERAEAAAAEAEAGAVLGKVAAPQADALRGQARYARLKARWTARGAVRHQQAERLRQLQRLGVEAEALADTLPQIGRDNRADLAEIEAREAAIRERDTGFNRRLIELAQRGVALEPELPLPGGMARATSAGVWARVHDLNPEGKECAQIVVGNRRITAIWVDHPDGILAALDQADVRAAQHDPAERLVISSSGLVQPVGRDPGGHIERRLRSGELRELSLPEKHRYFAGEQVSY
jgi:hypothetical protein